MQNNASTKLLTGRTYLLLAFVILLSFLTYFYRYAYPPHVYWDENYHIASAQKYLNGVYFMEQHPPLGKMLAALGEKILSPNEKTDQFLTTDYGTDFPADFSFAGYRFFSALLGWLTAPLLFLIFLLLTRNNLVSSLLSFFYIFDNGLIVHLRGAMLEGPLLFFCTLFLLLFFLALELKEDPKKFTWLSILLGVSFALILTTKVLGLIFILFFGAFALTLLPDFARIAKFAVLSFFGFVVVYCGVWYIHFASGSRIVPELPDNGYYQASAQYKNILAVQKNKSPAAFPVMLRDSLKYVSHYNNGAPRLDLCKDDENGSPFFLWPLGARTINYRWETPGNGSYRYLYLQSNPVVWLSAFASVLLAICFLVGSFFFRLQEPLKNPYLLSIFTGTYIAYMIAVSRIDRVLYLYHYFIPLLFSFIIFALVFMEIRNIGKWRVTEWQKTIGLMVLAAFIFAAHQFFRPLTYYEPITDSQFKKREWLGVWELSCVRCQKVSPLVIPTK